MSYFVLLWADAQGFQPGMPPDRPAQYGTNPMRAPWVVMTSAELRAAIADTQAAWDAYEAGLPPEPPVPEPPVYVNSPDASVWLLEVSDAGNITARKVP